MIVKLIEGRGLPTTAREWYRFGQGLYGQPTAAGPEVTAWSALTHATVFSCIRVLAESVAQLPAVLFERDTEDPRRRARAYGDRRYSLLHDQANDEMTSFDLFEFVMGSLALRGNSVCWKGFDGRGQLAELWPLRWDQITLRRAPTKKRELLYEWNPGTTQGDTFPASRIWHVRGFSLDGVQGVAPIALMRELVGVGLAAREYSARFFSKSSTPSGVLEVEKELSDKAYKRLKDSWHDAHEGLSGAQKTAILEGGTKWHQTSLAQKDAEFLQTVKFNRSEIAGWFRVPPHLIGDLERATFSNIEHQGIDFVRHALGPWLRRIELSIKRDLLEPSERARLFVKFLVDGMLRGDIQARYSAYNQGIMSGWLTRNEVREREDLDPREGLDEPLEPLNMIPAGMAGNSEPIPIPGKKPPPQLAPPEEELNAKTEKFDEAAAITSSSVLNGAQVASLVALVKSVQLGELPALSAKEIISIAFGIEADVAEKILSARSAEPRDLVERAVLEAEIGVSKRAAARRRRIMAAFSPVFAEATSKILRAEEREIGKLVAKHLEERNAEGELRPWRPEARDVDSFRLELEELYGEEGSLRRLMQSTLFPAVDGLTRGIFTEAASEIDRETDDAGVGDLVAVLLAATVTHHASKSQKRLGLLDLAVDEPRALVDSTFEEWKEVRPAQVAKRETVRQANAAARNAYAKSGVRYLRWIADTESCPWCLRMNRKVVEIDSDFVTEGETWEAEGHDPLNITHPIAHPPLHKGCECDIGPA